MRRASGEPGSIAYTDRSCRAAETLARVEPMLRQYGITRVARITGLDRLGIPVWNAARPNAKSLSIHHGKGITDDDARASATMEAIERAIAESVSIPTILASKQSLATRGVLFDDLPSLLAVRQRPPEQDEAIEWIEGRSLVSGVPILLPKDAIALDRTRPSGYWQSSDGLASGNTFEEAALHGLLERVERDADTLWSLNKRPTRMSTRFDAADLQDPVVNHLVERIASAGLQLVLYDMTTEIGIPSVSALIGPSPGSVPRMRYADAAGGSGSHPIAVRAAIRAITEAAQSRLTLITGARDDVDPKTYQDDLSPSLIAELSSPAVARPPADMDFPDPPGAPLLSHVVRAVCPHTERIYAVDLVPGETRLSVAKVIVPDLENPAGGRRQRFGRRGLARLMVF